jgi:bifunctional ADP-heptose synthase (sugar kinase/adenylyltransferase)
VTASKVLDREALLAAAARERRGASIVFANGAFDLLHVGHVRYLEGARRGGLARRRDQAPTGPSRARRGRRGQSSRVERAEIVAALGCVNAVAIFDEDSRRADRGAATRRPRQGPDLGRDRAERAVVATYGGRTAIVGDAKDHATTDLVARIKRS